MLSKVLRFFISFIIFLHCIGFTQLVMACAKDNAAFIGMLNMAEEETKKDIDEKEEIETNEFVKHKYLLLTAHLPTLFIQCFKSSDSAIKYQFLTENTTPPPDSKS